VTLSDLPSPTATRLRSPRWLDARLLAGLLLVLGSVVIGARVVAAADDSTRVWAAARDLPAGAVISADELVPVELRLERGGGRYVLADGEPPVGHRLSRDVGREELVPRAVLLAPDDPGDVRLVTVPVAQFHFPHNLRANERVDVYVTAKPRAGQEPSPPRLVIEGARVADVDRTTARFGAAGSGAGVVLAVQKSRVSQVVAAIQLGSVDLVRVPVG
jgi:hypothetical protein